MSRNEAIAMVDADEVRWIGGADTKVEGPVTMVVPTYLEGRTWRPTPSGHRQGLKIWQFVPDR